MKLMNTALLPEFTLPKDNIKSIKMSVYLCRRSVPSHTKLIHSLLLKESGISGRWAGLLFCSPSYPNGPGVCTGCCWTGEWWGRCRQASPAHAVQGLLLSPHIHSLALYSWWKKKDDTDWGKCQFTSFKHEKSEASNKTADSKFMPSFSKSRSSNTLNFFSHQLNNRDSETTATPQTPGPRYARVAGEASYRK